LSDIFREVDEEIRRDELKATWDRYGIHLIAVCLAVILGVGGYKGWQAYQKSRAEAAGSRYAQAVELAQASKSDDAFNA